VGSSARVKKSKILEAENSPLSQNILRDKAPHLRRTNTYSFTPWSRVLLEKLTGFQPVKKFPTFHGTQRFISRFTSAR
jgi:hypothetical protein